MRKKPGRIRDRQPLKTKRPQTTTERGLGYTWQKTRARVVAETGYCVRCWELRGIVTPVDEVHHIVPRRVNPKLIHERSNLRPLCLPCHRIEEQESSK